MNSTAIITHIYIGGKWVKHDDPRGNREAANFVIMCKYGDWSGFRTLQECVRQQPPKREDFFYWIEER